MTKIELYEEILLAKENGWSERFNELTELFYNTYNQGYLQFEEQFEETIIIKVYYEDGYRWSVDIEGQEESFISNVSKTEAMKAARQLKKELGNVVIEEQKLSRQEKADNIRYLHENGSSYIKF